MTNVVGADISYWQGVIDFERMRRKVQFLFIRAAHGKGLDTRTAANVQGAIDHNIPYGLYHYVKPAYSWQTQADIFITAIMQYGSPLPPVVDLEEDGGLNKTGLEGWVFKFQRKVEAETGQKLMIYTSPGFFNIQMPLTDWAWRMPLWVAHWDVKMPILPYEWSNHSQPWDFWQYSAKGNGLGPSYGCPGSNDIDLDEFNGSAAAFVSRFGVQLPWVDAPEPETLPEWVTVNGVGVNVRNAPSTAAGTKVGKYDNGGRLPVTGESGDWYEVKAYIHKDYARRA